MDHAVPFQCRLVSSILHGPDVIGRAPTLLSGFETPPRLVWTRRCRSSSESFRNTPRPRRYWLRSPHSCQSLNRGRPPLTKYCRSSSESFQHHPRSGRYWPRSPHSCQVSVVPEACLDQALPFQFRIVPLSPRPRYFCVSFPIVHGGYWSRAASSEATKQFRSSLELFHYHRLPKCSWHRCPHTPNSVAVVPKFCVDQVAPIPFQIVPLSPLPRRCWPRSPRRTQESSRIGELERPLLPCHRHPGSRRCWHRPHTPTLALPRIVEGREICVDQAIPFHQNVVPPPTAQTLSAALPTRQLRSTVAGSALPVAPFHLRIVPASPLPRRCWQLPQTPRRVWPMSECCLTKSCRSTSGWYPRRPRPKCCSRHFPILRKGLDRPLQDRPSAAVPLQYGASKSNGPDVVGVASHTLLRDAVVS